MTKKSKKIAIIAVIIVLIFALWLWYYSSQNQNTALQQQTGVNTQNSSSVVPALTQGTSDAAISQDINSLDQQLNGVSSDTASVDQSLNQ